MYGHADQGRFLAERLIYHLNGIRWYIAVLPGELRQGFNRYNGNSILLSIHSDGIDCLKLDSCIRAGADNCPGWYRQCLAGLIGEHYAALRQG